MVIYVRGFQDNHDIQHKFSNVTLFFFFCSLLRNHRPSGGLFSLSSSPISTIGHFHPNSCIEQLNQFWHVPCSPHLPSSHHSPLDILHLLGRSGILSRVHSIQHLLLWRLRHSANTIPHSRKPRPLTKSRFSSFDLKKKRKKEKEKKKKKKEGTLE